MGIYVSDLLIHLLFQKIQHCLIVLRDMRITTAGTVLKYASLFILSEYRIAGAVRIRIHGTVAKQAVKCFVFHSFMTRKIFAVFIFKELMTVFHDLKPPVILSQQ